jgi:hypothetical protein
MTRGAIGTYLENLRVFGEYLILNGTQALGILSHAPGAGAPSNFWGTAEPCPSRDRLRSGRHRACYGHT